MSANASTIDIKLQIDSDGAVRVLDQFGAQGKKSLGEVEKSSKQLTSGLKGTTSALIAMGGAVAGVLAVKGAVSSLTSATMGSINAASDLQETASKFDTVFAGQTAAAGQWSKALVDGYAMSTRESKLFLSSVQDLLVPMGMNAKAAGQMSFEATKLAADLGSFNNLGTAQVMENIQSALVGEYEPMKKYGVVLTAATVQQQALNMGLAETADALTAGDKAQAAYALIVRSSTAAVGDMARTSEGYANQTKLMTARIEDARAALGEGLLPVATVVVREINRFIGGLDISNEAMGTLAKEGVLWVTDAIGGTIETLRFFHNGWLGIKLVGTAAVHAIAVSLDELMGGVRSLLVPLDLIYDGMVKLGLLDVNPFDSIEQGLGTFRASSADVTQSVIEDIASTNATYDKVGAKIKDLRSKIEAVSVSHSAVADAAVTAAEQQAKAAGDAAAAEQKTAVDMTAAVEETFTASWQRIEKARMAGVDKAIKAHEAEEKAYEEATRAAREAAADRLRAYQSMYSDLDEYAKDSFDLQLDLLEKQADEYCEVTNDQALVAEWFVEKYEELEKRKLLASDDFFGAVAIGWRDSRDDLTTWGQTGYDIVRNFADNSSGAMSDILFDGLKGDLDDFSDYWDSMFDSMLRTVTDTVSDMATQQLVDAAVSGIDWLGSDLLGWWDTGAYDVKQDHLAMVHKGEMIIPADEAGVIRRATGSEAEGLAIGTPGGGWNGFGDVAAGFWGGTAAAFGKRAGAGLGLYASGKIDFGDFVGGAFSLQNIARAAVFGGIPSAVNAATGITGKWGSLGSMLAQLAGSAALGPAASLLGPFGSLIGDLLGDALNMRSHEELRDAFEEALGWRKGHLAYKSWEGGELGANTENAGVSSGSHGYGGYGGYASGRGRQGGGWSGTGIYGEANPWGGSYTTEDPSAWGNYGGGDGGGGGPSHAGSGPGGSGGGFAGHESMGLRHGGWSDGPSTGHWELLHGRELTLNEDQVNAVRTLNAGTRTSDRRLDELTASVNRVLNKIKKWDREGLPQARTEAA